MVYHAISPLASMVKRAREKKDMLGLISFLPPSKQRFLQCTFFPPFFTKIETICLKEVQHKTYCEKTCLYGTLP